MSENTYTYTKKPPIIGEILFDVPEKQGLYYNKEMKHNCKCIKIEHNLPLRLGPIGKLTWRATWIDLDDDSLWHSGPSHNGALWPALGNPRRGQANEVPYPPGDIDTARDSGRNGLLRAIAEIDARMGPMREQRKHLVSALLALPSDDS